MDRNLGSYVMVLENWIEPKVCMQTIEEIQKAPWQQHAWSWTTGESSARVGSKELDCAYMEHLSTKSYIMQRVWDALQTYIAKLNFHWFPGWSGFTEVRFNQYKENRQMLEHCDHIQSAFDGTRRGIPILSVLGLLNDNYSGGDFVMWQDEVMPLSAGSLIIFPSCFLYPHKVEPITEGTRYSFISWVW